MVAEEKPFLSILIPIRDHGRYLAGLLEAIRLAALDVDEYEVIVVDDGSREPLFIKSPENKRYYCIRHDAPRGVAAARNSAARLARGEVLLFLDADVEPLPGSIERMAARFKEDPALGALNAVTDMDPANADEGFSPRYRAFVQYVQKSLAPRTRCSVLETRFAAVRRRFFEEAGQFDPSYPGATVEDLEFSHRLREATDIGSDPEIRYRHHFPAFGKLTTTHILRVRCAVPLFLSRRSLENYGSYTGPLALASLAGCAIAPSALLLPSPAGALGACAAGAVFLHGYRREAALALRHKGARFFLSFLALSWWLSHAVSAGAILGLLDSFIIGRSRGSQPSPATPPRHPTGGRR